MATIEVSYECAGETSYFVLTIEQANAIMKVLESMDQNKSSCITEPESTVAENGSSIMTSDSEETIETENTCDNGTTTKNESQNNTPKRSLADFSETSEARSWADDEFEVEEEQSCSVTDTPPVSYVEAVRKTSIAESDSESDGDDKSSSFCSDSSIQTKPYVELDGFTMSEKEKTRLLNLREHHNKPSIGTQICQHHPHCINGKKCHFIHGGKRIQSSSPRKDCKWGEKCTRKDCYFIHPKSRDSSESSICRWGTGCSNQNCSFDHPENYYLNRGYCAYGIDCTRRGTSCTLIHANAEDSYGSEKQYDNDSDDESIDDSANESDIEDDSEDFEIQG